MNQQFYELLMEKTNFPIEAREELLRCAERVMRGGYETEFEDLLELYHRNDFRAGDTQPTLDCLARKAGISAYSLWLLVLMEWALRVKPEYERRGVSEEIIWDTFSDLKYKVLECQEIHGVWGNFVAFWYHVLFEGRVVKLGRLEFESEEYPLEEPFVFGDIVVKKGDPVKSVHIPSSGEAFDRAARLDAYRRAYAFFKPELGDRPLVCICDSWLLYPAYRSLLTPTSNIRDFMDDFRLLHSRDEEVFSDAWRLYGRNYQKNPAELPEDTSMRRAFKQHLLKGGKTGAGFGIMLFDGEKILTSQREEK